MIADPLARGRALAVSYAASEPALWRDLIDSAQPPAELARRLRREWECLALYACVRGLVAAGGFGEATERAVEALHAAVFEQWGAELEPAESLDERRARVAERYEAFGRIAQEADKAGGTAPRFGLLAARHAALDGVADMELAGLLGELHEVLAEGAAEVVRLGAAGEPAVELPPLEPLLRVLATLEAAGIPHAVGGSGLCAALGLVDQVRDWDVTCEADLDTLAALFANEPHERFGNSGCHADHKLNLDGGAIELIARFAFFTPGGIVRIATRVSARWRGLPVGSPEAWAVAYALMGELEDSQRRRERAELLFAHLAKSGADDEVIRLLLAEPLPVTLAARLHALPVRC